MKRNIGEPAHPVQPTTVPLLILKEITSRLSSFGIEVLNQQFISATLELCCESICSVYEEVISGNIEMSSNAALQLIADIGFLEVVFSGLHGDSLKRLRDEFTVKVWYSCSGLYLL